MELMQGDCLELMKKIPDGSVDAIIQDPPYGTTDCAFDKRIPFEPMWKEFLRVCKHNAAIVLFSQMPFGAELIMSQRKLFRYEWCWLKQRRTGFLNAKKMPLRCHENILVFYRALPTYNPQMGMAEPYVKYTFVDKKSNHVYANHEVAEYTKNETGERYPIDALCFKGQPLWLFGQKVAEQYHPTEKPINLLEYLIRTYTNEGEVVLDATMGSGSTGVACVNTGRKFIGIELDENFYQIAQERIEKAQALKAQELF